MKYILLILFAFLITSARAQDLSGYSLELDLYKRGGKLYLKKDSSLVSGTVQSYFKNGRIKSKGTYTFGKKHGLIEEWFDNGQKKSEGQYKEGRKYKSYRKWYQNGAKQEEAIARDVILPGFSSISRWYKNGRVSYLYELGKDKNSVTGWHDNGVLKSKYYEKEITEFVSASEEVLKNLSDEQIAIENGDRGILMRFVKIDGFYQEWYSDGKIKKESNYKFGNAHGSWKEWFPNGQIGAIKFYEDGEEHGVFKYYSKNGKLTFVETYDHGQLISREIH
ncbi:MAG: hypothetical protein HKN00_00150 [Flavobacteriaceae bacterium]|nr:hypothetical protein [Bacteroidia bacterium]MBT8286531.1 hypothetical protein [Bacteroidia bacterium]NNF73565.1 hypothetical protein [Flavobacteriaceae bacterium]NNK73107.1 hypothetical protein [Flavobacteriaceae bacterium]